MDIITVIKWLVSVAEQHPDASTVVGFVFLLLVVPAVVASAAGPPHPGAAESSSAGRPGRRTSRTSSPPSPTARCASASTWTVVVAGPAPASDTVLLYGVP